MRKHIKILFSSAVCIAVLGGVGTSLTLDTLRNNTIVKIASRPAEPIPGNPDKVLDHFVNGTPLPDEEDLTSQLEGICTYIDGRYDCADFRLVSLMQILYRHSHRLTAPQRERIKRTILSFKYWWDEPGQDSMCYWSENHQILFASAEYLAGQLYPDEKFTNDGLTGRKKIENARERILTWLEQRWAYGFTEFYSNVYYVEDIGPLANLIDFAEDPEIVAKARIIMDLLLYDLASHSHQGTFAPASGRAYEKNRKSGVNASVGWVIQQIWGYPLGTEERRGMDQSFTYLENYKIPEVIRLIGLDQSEQIIKASNGLNVSELDSEGLLGQDPGQLMMQWAMEAFTNPEVISNTLAAINKYEMLSQESFNDFKMVNYNILRNLGLLPVISRVLNPQTNGVAIQRGNVYTYRNGSFAMSTAQSYHPGTHGDQQAVFQATVDNELSIFNSHPAVWAGDGGPNGNSPTYWVGAGRLPHSVQDRNINLSLYILPPRPGLMEKRMIPYTHAWMPEAFLDEVEEECNYIFARRGDVYIALIGKGPLEYIIPEQITKDGAADPPGRREIIQHGRTTYWITELSTEAAEGAFSTFQTRIKTNPVSLLGDTLTYTSNNRELKVSFAKSFQVNGEIINTEYARFDSTYIQAERNPETLFFTWRGRSLLLDFDKMIRLEG
jgi:hypothetical protein